MVLFKGTPYPNSFNAYGSSNNRTGITFEYLPSQNITGKRFKVELTTQGTSPSAKYGADGTVTDMSFNTFYTVPSFNTIFQIIMESTYASSKFRVVWE